MTYNPNKAFAESMKAAGIGGLSGKPTTSAAKTILDRFKEQTQKNSGSTYDEIALPSEKKIDQKIEGLGGKKPTKDDRNLDQKIFDGMMSYGARFLGLNRPDPRADDMFILDAYNSDPMFVIPDPVPVTETGINTGTYDFIDMSKPVGMLTSGPKQPKTQPNIDTTPQIGGVDEVPTIDRNQVVGKGLGSPQGAAATMESVPNIPDVVQGRKTADYTIQSGDTLSELANITGSTVEELMALNNIKNKNRIFAGKDIKIPIYRDSDAEVVANASSMKELEPIKAGYFPLVNALPPVTPPEKTNTFIENIGMFGEGDHGSTPVVTKDAAEAGKPDSEKSLDIGYGHKIKRGSKEDTSGEIYGIKYKNADGSYIPLTKEQKLTILRKDFEKHTNEARNSGWDRKLKEKGGSWNELDPKYQNALSSLAINVGGAKAGNKWTKVLDAAMAEDPVAFAKELRRMDTGKHTAGMDNRVMKELFYAGIITNRSEVEDVLPKATIGSGVPG